MVAQIRPPVLPQPDSAGRAGRSIRAVLALAFFGVALLYTAVIHFATPVYPEDDAFIIYRYVDNVVAGKGLVYNEGQRVFGASTPLYVAGLALAKTVLRSTPTPDLAVRLNFIAYLAAGLGLFLLLRRLTGRRAAAALLAAFFILRDDMLRVSTGGMEAFLFVGLMLWSLWALAGQMFVLAGILAGVSVLARLEGVLLAGLVLVGWLVADRRKILPVLAGLFVPGLAWIAFGFAYYGTPVYHSIVAKSRPLYPLRFGDAPARIWKEIECRALGNLARWPANGEPIKWRFTVLTVATLLLLGLAVWGCSRRREPRASELDLGHDPNRLTIRSCPSLVLLGLFLLLYLVTNPLMFPWYYPPVIVLWYVATIAGISRLGRPQATVRRRASSRVITALLVLFFGVTTLRQPLGRAVTGGSLADIGLTGDPVRTRIAAYRAAAEWLNQTLPDGVTVVGPEVGSLGYYYKGPLVDACGLVSPEALPFLPVPAAERFSADCGTISRELVQALTPDVVVTMGTFAGISLYTDPWFKQSYVKVKMFDLPEQAWNTPTVDVFFRADRVSR